MAVPAQLLGQVSDIHFDAAELGREPRADERDPHWGVRWERVPVSLDLLHLRAVELPGSVALRSVPWPAKYIRPSTIGPPQMLRPLDSAASPWLYGPKLVHRHRGCSRPHARRRS